MKKLSLLIAATAFAMSISCNILGNAANTPTPVPGASDTPTPIPVPGAIRGSLWHELCKFTGGQAGEPVVLGQGCVQWGAAPEEFGPNQVKDDFESGWAGVTLHLGTGACPSTGLGTAVTNAAGEYQFEGLSAGTYCVSYSNLTDGNDTLLIPGGPTFPARGEDGFFATVDLSAGEEVIIDFGYAWQFYN